MGIFNDIGKMVDDHKKKKTDKKNQEIFEAKVRLEKLKQGYEHILSVNRRIVNTKPTKREREMAESRIQSAICGYTIVCEAQNQLDSAASDEQLNNMLKELNKSLCTLHKVRPNAGKLTKMSVKGKVRDMQKADGSLKPEEQFSDETIGTIDEWLGQRFSDVAQKYITGMPLDRCMRESQFILEDSDPMPYAREYSDAFASDTEGGVSSENALLDDLLASDVFMS